MIRRGLTSETFASETIRQVLHAHVVTSGRHASIKFRKLVRVPLSWLQVLNGASSSSLLPFPLFFSFDFFFFTPVRVIAVFSLNLFLLSGENSF